MVFTVYWGISDFDRVKKLLRFSVVVWVTIAVNHLFFAVKLAIKVSRRMTGTQQKLGGRLNALDFLSKRNLCWTAFCWPAMRCCTSKARKIYGRTSAALLHRCFKNLMACLARLFAWWWWKELNTRLFFNLCILP